MGGNNCSICTNEAREAVDQALVAGGSNRVIASQYGLDKSAVGRHRQNHLSATLVKAAEAHDEAHGSRLLNQSQRLVDEAWASIERSKAVGKEKDVLGGIREARHSLELEGRITGELRDRDAAPDTALDAILKLAHAMSEAELRRMAGLTPAGQTIEGESHVVD